jgi:RecG-like helicase
MVNNNSNSSNTANTAEDLSKMTNEELEQKIDELAKNKKHSEIYKYSEELSKREKVQNINTSEQTTKSKMEELLNRKVLKKKDKEELKKLLEEHQREREQKRDEDILNAEKKHAENI